ncbi:DNA translocase FtsK, partial [Anaerostipes hadrus]|uniref:DNA translocase FtsK n=1 Tax=Anaerostipes hadrus TaxID=649756 RepID=UPI002473C7D1
QAGYQKRNRVQGAFGRDEEVSKDVEVLKEENNAEESYGADIQEKIQTEAVKAETSQERDEYFEKAAEFISDKDKAAIASLQRVFKIGFKRAARLMDQLC